MWEDDEWQDFIEKYDVVDLFLVYFTVYNGNVKVLRTDHNHFMTKPFFTYEEETYILTPMMIMQKDFERQRAYVYVLVVPSIGKNDTTVIDKDTENFKNFIKNLKPEDFKF